MVCVQCLMIECLMITFWNLGPSELQLVIYTSQPTETFCLLSPLVTFLLCVSSPFVFLTPSAFHISLRAASFTSSLFLYYHIPLHSVPQTGHKMSLEDIFKMFVLLVE